MFLQKAPSKDILVNKLEKKELKVKIKDIALKFELGAVLTQTNLCKE